MAALVIVLGWGLGGSSSVSSSVVPCCPRAVAAIIACEVVVGRDFLVQGDQELVISGLVTFVASASCPDCTTDTKKKHKQGLLSMYEEDRQIIHLLPTVYRIGISIFMVFFIYYFCSHIRAV